MLDLAAPAKDPATPRLQRAEGAARVAFRKTERGTVLDRLHQSGAARVRLPRSHGENRPTAVLLNTAGGLTGGDRMTVDVAVGEGAEAVVATQASEKIYRASGGVAEVASRLSIAQGGRIDWLPQETILFDGAALSRRLDVTMAPGARLTAVESVVFGRAAMAETEIAGTFRDAWRVRRGGRLVFADATRLDGEISRTLSRPAAAASRAAAATLVHVAPDAAGRLEAVRAVLGGEAGASTFDGVIVVRVVAPTGQALRRTVAAALTVLRDGAPLPRVWTC